MNGSKIRGFMFQTLRGGIGRPAGSRVTNKRFPSLSGMTMERMSDMRKVVFGECNPLFLKEEETEDIVLGKADYELRVDALKKRMSEKGIDYVMIYGDREHFSTVCYFSAYDCRFEETILIFDRDGSASILVGNEGISQTLQIPYPFRLYLYQNFSLLGQPRDQQEMLSVILKKIGFQGDSRIGVVGYKYFEKPYIPTDPSRTFDIPMYIMEELYRVCPPQNVTNFTSEIMGFPDGIRMQLRTAREIAWIECAGNRTAAVVQRMIKCVKPGLSEREVASASRPGMEPVPVYPMINFGERKVSIGVTSPTDRVLKLGEVCGLCYCTRGNLTSRVGIGAYDESTAAEELKGNLAFYQEYWLALAELLELIKVGAGCAQMHDIVMARIGGPEYGLHLNVTHYSGTDEWTNSPVFKGSPYFIHDGAHIQIDVIASRQSPFLTAICEDCIVVAGEKLRGELRTQYPEVYARVLKRQELVRKELGINIHPDVLPMSNLDFVYTPYMLNFDRVFRLE